MSRPSEVQTTARTRERGVASSSVPVLEAHALWAPTYDRDPNPLLALEERELDPLLPELKDKHVMDVACGTGRWLKKLFERGARSGAGIDLSPPMLAQAAHKTLLRGRLVRGDLLALPFADGGSDLTVCSFAVGYVGDLESLARELARVARSRADLFVTDFHPAAHLRGWKRTFRCANETVEIASVPHPIERIGQAFSSEGFELFECREARLGEPEKAIFEQAGKGHLFAAAREVPAVFICHFKLPERCRAQEV